MKRNRKMREFAQMRREGKKTKERKNGVNYSKRTWKKDGP